MSKKVIALLGAGSFGTAIAQLLAHNGHTVNLWSHEESVIASIATHRENKKYLPGIPLHKNIIPTTDLSLAMSGVQWVFEAIPVAYLRSVLEQARPFAHKDQSWVVLSKGIEDKTLLFPSQMIADVFGYEVNKAILAGPSFARELAEGAITGVTIGANPSSASGQAGQAGRTEMGAELQKMLENEFFRAHLTFDLMGVQVGAAFKNVISLGVGMLDGAGYGDNPKAFLLTQGLAEAADFAGALGGKRDTLYGFSGVGDLVLTSTGKASRNREVGRLVGSGESLDAIMERTGYVCEGVNAVQGLIALAQKNKIPVPLCAGINDVLNGCTTVEKMMKNILQVNRA